jgi:hypothetical protein
LNAARRSERSRRADELVGVARPVAHLQRQLELLLDVRVGDDALEAGVLEDLERLPDRLAVDCEPREVGAERGLRGVVVGGQQ